MYGGNGVFPTSPSRSSTGRGDSLASRQRPSPSESSQRSHQSAASSALRRSPGRGRPRISASQRSWPPAGSSGRRNRTSMRPPVARRKKARAGNTRVSLRTSTSPRRRRAGRSAKRRSRKPASGHPVAGTPASPRTSRGTTSSREASRGSTGCWATSSGGSVVVEVGQGADLGRCCRRAPQRRPPLRATCASPAALRAGALTTPPTCSRAQPQYACRYRPRRRLSA